MPLFRFLVKLALILAFVGAGYMAYLSYQETQKMGDQLSEQSAQVRALEQQLNSSLPDLRRDFNSQLKANQDSMAQLHSYVTDTALRLTESQGVTRYEWLLAEAEYLMRLAQQRLVLERDALGALSMLQSADKVLADTQDTNLIHVRQQLAREMAALAGVRSLDREGLYVQITLLIEALEAWSPASALAEQQPDLSLQDTPITWKDRLRQFIRISKVDALEREPVQPHLVPLYRGLLQNSLSQAQTALLRQQPEAYRVAIGSAQRFYQRYGASPGSPQNLEVQIDQLAGIQLDSELPELGAALSLLKDYIAKVYQLQRTAPEER